MTRPIIYIAGPMRGLHHFGFPAFDNAAEHLRDAGWTVLSPAEHDREGGFDETKEDSPFDLQAAMRWDLQAVLRAHAVALLPGWRQSAGVAIEVTVAEAVGVPLYEFDPLAPRCLRPLVPESPAEEAHRLVHGARQASYGHPADDFTRTGRMIGAILGIPDVAPELVGLIMATVKISREVNAHKADNIVDLCGYALTVSLVHEHNQRKEASA